MKLNRLTSLLASVCLVAYAGLLWAADMEGLRVLNVKDPRQPFDMAAKIQWNPHHKRWDKVLVLYNGAKEPPQKHPMWVYVKGLRIPDRGPNKPGENLFYKTFRSAAMCREGSVFKDGQTWIVDFDQHKPGPYRHEAWLNDWHCPDWQMGRRHLRISDSKQTRNAKGKALRVDMPAGLAGCQSDKSCVNFKPQFGQSLQRMTFQYWLKLPTGFEFALGGKLPGIGSMEAASGGGRPNGLDGWSVRLMWDKDGRLGQYVYHMDQKDHFGDFMPWMVDPLQPEKWHLIKTYVQLNTPGQPDGVIQSWLNGQSVFVRRNLRFRRGDGLAIERALFSVFYGGGGPKYAPRRPQHFYLDDFSFSPK